MRHVDSLRHAGGGKSCVAAQTRLIHGGQGPVCASLRSRPQQNLPTASTSAAAALFICRRFFMLWRGGAWRRRPRPLMSRQLSGSDVDGGGASDGPSSGRRRRKLVFISCMVTERKRRMKRFLTFTTKQTQRTFPVSVRKKSVILKF